MECKPTEHQWVAPVRFVLAAVGSDVVGSSPVSVWAAPTATMPLDPNDAPSANWSHKRRQKRISNEPTNAEVFCSACEMLMAHFFSDPLNMARLGLHPREQVAERAYWRAEEGER